MTLTAFNYQIHKEINPIKQISCNPINCEQMLVKCVVSLINVARILILKTVNSDQLCPSINLKRRYQFERLIRDVVIQGMQTCSSISQQVPTR